MPLFMDFHQMKHVTIEDVKRAHIADTSVQEKYGVCYHQFWVNEEAGTIFCLMEGPSKEACEAVHREAHGNIACAMVEVEPGFYNIMMGQHLTAEEGLVHRNGEQDLGYRYILVLSVRAVLPLRTFSSKATSDLIQVVSSFISAHHGRQMQWSEDDSMIAVFDTSKDLMSFLFSIQQRYAAQIAENKIVFKVGVSAGQPLDMQGDLFSETLIRARELNTAASDNHVLVSSLASRLCRRELHTHHKSIRLLDESEESFLTHLIHISQVRIAEENFTIDDLTHEMGVSRPQLYRKITSLTGRSPNAFLRDLRLSLAFNLLQRKKGNISEVALEVGYHNPSYFSKCFTEKFGCTPSAFLEAEKI